MHTSKILWLVAVGFALGCGACAQQGTPNAVHDKALGAREDVKLTPIPAATGAWDVLACSSTDFDGPARTYGLDRSGAVTAGILLAPGSSSEALYEHHSVRATDVAFSSDSLAESRTLGESPATTDRARLAQAAAKPNTLTAGSFDDNNYRNQYVKFLQEEIDKKASEADVARQFTGRRAWVKVVDREGRPVEDAVVTVNAADGPISMKTRADGRAVFMETWDHVDGPVARLTIAAPSMDQPVHALASFDTAEPVVIPIDSLYDGGRQPSRLDVMFVVDCTGSMGDELAYLKVEVQSIGEAVAKQFPHVAIRFGLICYRDVKDEYVVRDFDFTASLEDFKKNLGEQKADGGGDGPEAMEQALAAAAACDWGAADTVRVAFLIADAPPHTPDMLAGMKAMNGLRSKGVGLYPVACSGVDPQAEFFMRTAAVSTLGTYLFATDHSGVGNSHAEPHFPHYQVEKLAPLMERMIAGELSGHVVAAKAEDVIATVDVKPSPDGVAEKNGGVAP